MTIRHASNRNSDGTMVGQDKDDKVGFFGAQPKAQNALAANADAAAIVAELVRLGLVRAA